MGFNYSSERICFIIHYCLPFQARQPSLTFYEHDFFALLMAFTTNKLSRYLEIKNTLSALLTHPLILLYFENQGLSICPLGIPHISIDSWNEWFTLTTVPGFMTYGRKRAVLRFYYLFQNTYENLLFQLNKK